MNDKAGECDVAERNREKAAEAFSGSVLHERVVGVMRRIQVLAPVAIQRIRASY